MSERGEQRLVEAFVPEPAVEALDEGVLLWVAGRDVEPSTRASRAHLSTPRLVSSVPLSESKL
jgi:hypothetical protein